MEDSLMKVRAAIKLRREQLAFDKLPEKEKENRRRCGLDPYEPEEIRKKKQAATRQQWKRHFDRLPAEARNKLTELGVSPYQKDDAVIRRLSGPIKAV